MATHEPITNLIAEKKKVELQLHLLELKLYKAVNELYQDAVDANETAIDLLIKAKSGAAKYM